MNATILSRTCLGSFGDFTLYRCGTRFDLHHDRSGTWVVDLDERDLEDLRHVVTKRAVAREDLFRVDI